MRILVISPQQPHPDGNNGGALYLGLLLRALSRIEGVTVGGVCYRHAQDPAEMAGVTWHTVPRRFNREISGLTLRAQQIRNAWRWGVRAMPLEVAKLRTRAFSQTLQEAIESFKPDVALVEFSVMAWCLKPLRDAGVPTCFTDHEQGASPVRRLGPTGLGPGWDRRLWTRYTRTYYPIAGLCQALTEVDAAALSAKLNRPVALRSPLIPMPDEVVDPGAAGPVMLFFGNYLHHPNPESAIALATEVLPRVRKRLPDAELWLAGAQAGGNVKALDALDGVRFLGFVDDLAGVIGQARCAAAPVYSGSGVRTKSLFAMAHGLPIVANQLGLQGMGAPEATYSCGESADELASACLRYLEDPAAAREAGRAARAFVDGRFDADECARQQLARIQDLL